MQLIPQIAPNLAELTVFQRTAIWVTPKTDGRPEATAVAVRPLPAHSARRPRLGSSILEVIMVAGVLKYSRFKAFNRMAERVASCTWRAR